MHKLMKTQQYILNDEWATKEIKKIKKFPELNKNETQCIKNYRIQ